MPDHSYEAAYAAWQAELREAARRPDREDRTGVATRAVRRGLRAVLKPGH